MKSVEVFKFIIYHSPSEITAKVLCTDGNWRDYEEHEAKFILWETDEEAESFCRTLNSHFPTLNSVVTMQKCYVNAWYHTREQEEELYRTEGMTKWDTDLLVYEGDSIQCTDWFISKSKYHPQALLADTGHYTINHSSCYIIKNEAIQNPLTTSIPTIRADRYKY
ncbi:hypothetical protein U8V72_21425 [Priestia filamentosa]|uniref:hypothetical protein n=1 Tax=Priestia filamentosa TaxID=1402861 RepID=UPI003977EEDA